MTNSETFANNLEIIMGQEGALSRLAENAGLIQIHPPTQDERGEADLWMNLAFVDGSPVAA